MQATQNCSPNTSPILTFDKVDESCGPNVYVWNRVYIILGRPVSRVCQWYHQLASIDRAEVDGDVPNLDGQYSTLPPSNSTSLCVIVIVIVIVARHQAVFSGGTQPSTRVSSGASIDLASSVQPLAPGLSRVDRVSRIVSPLAISPYSPSRYWPNSFKSLHVAINKRQRSWKLHGEGEDESGSSYPPVVGCEARSINSWIRHCGTKGSYREILSPASRPSKAAGPTTAPTSTAHGTGLSSFAPLPPSTTLHPRMFIVPCKSLPTGPGRGGFVWHVREMQRLSRWQTTQSNRAVVTSKLQGLDFHSSLSLRAQRPNSCFTCKWHFQRARHVMRAAGLQQQGVPGRHQGDRTQC
jgi:hypothetical protein